MTRFIQLHLLTFHAPSNINRDDTGRPKTAIIGGTERLRISSQAFKRAIRTSEQFAAAMKGHLSERTRRLGDELIAALVEEGIDAKQAEKAAIEVASRFGKPEDPKGDHPAWIRQLAFISPVEKDAALGLARRIAAGEEVDTKKEPVLLHSDTAVDIAMFGRMLADSPNFNRDAAVQVAHPFTTHRIQVEDDYYTAVDDLNTGEEDAGAGFIGNLGFGSGVFYAYVCINRDLLEDNLGGSTERDLADRAIRSFIEAACTVTPTGKQNSFASHARASFALVETGDSQPRSLAGAFVRSVDGDDLMKESIKALRSQRATMADIYDDDLPSREMNLPAGTGSLAEILDFAVAGS